jgi:hypothetical protein
MNPFRCNRLKLLAWLVALPVALAHAQSLPQPKGPVILTVGGHISVRNAGELAVFDAAMLNALQVHEITTKSPWKKAVMQFSGPSIRTLLKAVGAQGTSLKLAALDKYEASVPMEDVTKFDPVLALRVDGVALTVRTQGPVLVMYPFDNVPEINTDLYAGRAVWQLQRIVVE